MNSNAFLEKLEASLGNLPRDDRQEILQDYQEHFREGIEAGRTESQIADALGDPKMIGRLYRADLMVERAEESATFKNVSGAAIAVIGLGLFNLIFVAGPVLLSLLILMALWMITLSVVLVSLAAFVASILYALFPSFVIVGGTTPLMLSLLSFFLSLGFLSLGIMTGIGMSYLTRIYFRMLVRYLQFNLEIFQK